MMAKYCSVPLYSLANLLLHGSISTPLTPCVESVTKSAGGFNFSTSKLPGLLDCLSMDHVHMLLCSLRYLSFDFHVISQISKIADFSVRRTTLELNLTVGRD